IDYGNFEISVYSTTCIWILVENIYRTGFVNYCTLRKLLSSTVQPSIVCSISKFGQNEILTNNAVREILDGWQWIDFSVETCHSETSRVVYILHPCIDCLVSC